MTETKPRAVREAEWQAEYNVWIEARSAAWRVRWEAAKRHPRALLWRALIVVVSPLWYVGLGWVCRWAGARWTDEMHRLSAHPSDADRGPVMVLTEEEAAERDAEHARYIAALDAAFAELTPGKDERPSPARRPGRAKNR